MTPESPFPAAVRLLVVGNGPTGVGEDGDIHVDLTCGQFLMDLSRSGVRVALAQPREPLSLALNYYGCVLPPDKVRSIALERRPPLAALRTGWALLWDLIRADVVYLFFPGTLPRLVAPICRLLGRPYGIYLRGDRFSTGGRDGTILAGARFVLATSPGMGARARELNSHVGLIRPMCEISAGDAVRRDHRTRRAGPLRLLFVGRIEADKGVPELIDAAELLRQRKVDFELSLVGWGDLYAEIAQRFANDPHPDIRLVGAIEDRRALMRMYEEADIFILPTHHEGFPRTLYEAMIKSAVVITTMVGGIPGIMRDGENCLAVPVDDANAIAEAVERLGSDLPLMQHLAEGGLQTTLAVFESAPPHADALLQRMA
jgi:glycosyltransferase involved in cell wall biosynthesis